MAETISQRVNTLFASYVATEDEQRRLGELGTTEALEQASNLGTPALAIRDEVFAIRDRSGCVDLVAARILLDLMLSHRWPPEPDIEWGEDIEVALPMLEILADRVTGAVRIETRRALATIGVDVQEEAADPLLALVTEYRSNYDTAFAAWEASHDDALDEAAVATWKPLWDRLCDNPPAATSLAGVQAALQLVHSEAEKDTGSVSSLTSSLTGAALAYFGRA